MSTADIFTSVATAKVNTAIATGKIITPTSSGSITNVVVVTVSDGGGGEDVSKIIPFSNSDLINGKLIKLHGLNRRVVDVTIANGSGLEFKPDVDNLNDQTRVQVDLSRYDIQGIWYLLIQ